MKNMKKILTVACAMALSAAIAVGGTLAYLTKTTETVTNTFTVGKVNITLNEAKVNEDGKPVDASGNVVTDLATAHRVTENDYHLLPGHNYTKDPTVYVTKGSEECYVRMFVTITKSAAWDAIFSDHAGEFTLTDIVKGYDADAWLYQGNDEDKAAPDTRTYEFWYKDKVTNIPANAEGNSDKALKALFTDIQVPGILTNAELETVSGFHIYVVAQAIQADGFTGTNAAASAFGAAPAITGSDLIPSAQS